MMRCLPILPHHAHQRGIALVVSMMMLVAITLVGIAVMGNSRLEWLMASNSNLQKDTLADAQTALAQAEGALRALVCAGGPPAFCNAANVNWTTAGDALYPSPFGSNPRNVANWDTLFVSQPLGSTDRRYIVIYQGCSFPPGAAPPGAAGLGCGTDNVTPFTDTYEVWVLVTQAGTAARIVRSTFVTVSNPPGTPGSIPPPYTIQGVGVILMAGQSLVQRVGYSEINTTQ